MKKLFAVFMVIVLALSIISMIEDSFEGLAQRELIKKQTELEVRFENSLNIYPMYESVTDVYKEYYTKLCAGFDIHAESILINEFASESEVDSVKEWIDDNYRDILFEQPDYFWVDPYGYVTETIQQGDSYTLKIEPIYTVLEEELTEKKEIYNRTVDEIAENALMKPLIFDSVLYVYDTILEKTDYDHELAESDDSDISRSAYGCLVEGATVCSGYTLAFTSIMQKLGLTCGAEADILADGSLIKGDSHVWNYCKLEDEYYYFDLTWDDDGYGAEDSEKKDLEYTHDFFAITRDELKKTHDYLKDESEAYTCNADKYNYYTYNNLYCGDYSFSRIKQIMKNQSQEDYIVVKFSSEAERIRAEHALFDNYRFYEIFTDADRIEYVSSISGLHLYVFFR